ncbi:MAG: pitrilysin family protein [Bryobacteraceae bacterium]
MRPAAILLIAAAAFAQSRTGRPAPAAGTLGVHFGPPRTPNLEGRKTVKLANGFRAFWRDDRELPVVWGAVLIPLGSAADPPGKAGLASAAVRAMVQGGTAALPGEKLVERLQSMGAGLEAVTEPTRSMIAFRCLREDLDEVLSAVASLVTSPAPSEDAVDLALGVLRTGVGNRNGNAATAVAREASRLTYGTDTPMGARAEYDTLDNIGSNDVRRLYASALGPQETVLVLEGAGLAEAGALVEARFGGWKSATGAKPEAAKFEFHPTPGIHHMDDRGIRRALMTIAAPGGRMPDADFAAMAVATELLGGARGSRLAGVATKKRLWEMAWTIRWGAEFDYPGLFALNLNVDPAFAVEALEASLGLVRALGQEPPPAAELEQAKMRLLNAWSTELGMRGRLLLQSVTGELDGQAPEHLAALWGAVRQVTPAAVRDAVARNLDPAKFVIAAVGPETLYSKPLSAFNLPEHALTIAIPEASAPTPSSDPAAIERGKAMLARMAEALGGAERLAAIKEIDLRMTGSTRREPTDPWIAGEARERWIAPETIRHEMRIPGLEIITYYDGKIAWQGRNKVLYGVMHPILDRVRGEVFRHLFTLALSGSDPKRNVSHLGGDLVQVIGENDMAARIYLDPETGLPSRIRYRAYRADGASISVEEAYVSWAESGGVRWPAKTIMKENGRRAQEVEFVSVEINPGLDAAKLSEKP